MGVEKNGVLWRRPSIGRAVRLQECPLGELLLIVKRQNWVLTLWMVRRILVYIFCFIMTQAYHYLMKLVNWNFWILKEHNNFSFLRKFEQFRRNSLWKTPKSTIYLLRVNSCMLMRKDVNNDVTMNPPIRYPLFPSINPEVSTLSDIFRQIPTISI